MLQNTLVLLYSCVQKNGRCFIGRAFGFYAFYKSYISRLRYRYSWVRKSSSVIQMGLKLAVEILDSGYMNTAVLPVATFESQIEIVSKSVGKLSKGMGH
jgi:hypothetical protein